MADRTPVLFGIFDENFEQNSIPFAQSPYYTDIILR